MFKQMIDIYALQINCTCRLCCVHRRAPADRNDTVRFMLFHDIDDSLYIVERRIRFDICDDIFYLFTQLRLDQPVQTIFNLRIRHHDHIRRIIIR